MGLEVLQKSDDPPELFEGVFQIALGLEKTFVGIVQSSDIVWGGQHTGIEEDLEEKVTFLVVSPSTMKSLVKRLINNLPLPLEVSKILSPGVDDDTL